VLSAEYFLGDQKSFELVGAGFSVMSVCPQICQINPPQPTINTSLGAGLPESSLGNKIRRKTRPYKLMRMGQEVNLTPQEFEDSQIGLFRSFFGQKMTTIYSPTTHIICSFTPCF